MSAVPKCRCGKRPISYNEVWLGASILFYAPNADGVPTQSEDGDRGDPHHVEARCSCGRTWRLRGVTQITELFPGICEQLDGSAPPTPKEKP